MLRINAAEEILPGRLRKTHPNPKNQMANAASIDGKPLDKLGRSQAPVCSLVTTWGALVSRDFAVSVFQGSFCGT